MQYELPLPDPLPNDGWKVKIFDREPAYEEPHITIVRRRKRWRISLREHGPMDKDPPYSDISDDVMDEVEANWDLLEKEWNKRHPNNPV